MFVTQLMQTQSISDLMEFSQNYDKNSASDVDLIMILYVAPTTILALVMNHLIVGVTIMVRLVVTVTVCLVSKLEIKLLRGITVSVGVQIQHLPLGRGTPNLVTM